MRGVLYLNLCVVRTVVRESFRSRGVCFSGVPSPRYKGVACEIDSWQVSIFDCTPQPISIANQCLFGHSTPARRRSNTDDRLSVRGCTADGLA